MSYRHFNADFRGSKFNEDFGRFQHFDTEKEGVWREFLHSFFPQRGGFRIFPGRVGLRHRGLFLLYFGGFARFLGLGQSGSGFHTG